MILGEQVSIRERVNPNRYGLGIGYNALEWAWKCCMWEPEYIWFDGELFDPIKVAEAAIKYP